ncbi:MAG: glycoside hydrolase family 3 C-terminal domain-containing protein [Firmicutes bacterium]|nr:glycoside hydrolase family 3 C-terminal domain-containing protein [Bacillota bacterium]
MIDKIISDMTLEKKIRFCSGADFWHTKPLPEYDVLAMMMCDGPHGLRKQEDATDMLGINQAVPATCFPTAVSTACSWDENLLGKIGQAIAEEAAANGVGLVLGPGANIKRNPLCGRNFEYFSEDPYLTGKLAAGYIWGAESTGIGTSLKHFACNSQEYKRFSSDSILDERTLRELYLAGFEAAVKEGRPSTVMCAYNKINGVHCSDNKKLLTDILRKEWGFEGMVVTDWGAMSDRIRGFEAGCDLNMPGGSSYMEAEAARAVKDGTLDKTHIDCSALRVLQMVEKADAAVKAAKPVDMEFHYALARQAAEESAVLLKNEEGILPLSESRRVVFIGHMAKELRYQGAGSSHINPWRLSNVTEVCPKIPYAEGCDAAGDTTEALLAEAVRMAGEAETAVVFAGLTDRYESEGFDRENMAMSKGHNRLIEAVAEANPNTVVVLLCGSVVELPWADKVKGILYMGLPGEAGGEAIPNLLFGRAVPCGKLAESWPYQYSDCVSASYYVNERVHGQEKRKKDAHYREGLYVGYRYYTSAGVPVRYPFGYGLSYTSFSYSDLKINGDTVSCTVTNTGSMAGKEIVQLYIAPPEGPLYRPMRELKGFRKVYLEPGKSRTVEFQLSERSFAVWSGGWVIPSGKYTILVGADSENLPLSETVEKQGMDVADIRTPAWYFSPKGAPSHEDFEGLLGHAVLERPLRKGEFTMDNTVMEMKDYSLIMKIMFKAVEATVAKGFGGRKDYSDPVFRMMMNSAADASLSGMKISGGMNNHVLEGMLEIANGHPFRGIAKMLDLKK